MRFKTIATVLFAASVVELASCLDLEKVATKEQIEHELAQTLQQTLSAEAPKVMVEADQTINGTYLTAAGTGDAFQDGWYQNTTRETQKQYYTYMWRHACAFTKWIPSNQWLHEHPANPLDQATFGDIELSRFGLVGRDKRCYWGLVGVLWKRPLPLWEITGHHEPPAVSEPTTPVAPPEPTGPTEAEVSPDRQIQLDDMRSMAVGFPGKEVDGEPVLQIIEANDQTIPARFDIYQIEDGDHAGMYTIKLHDDPTKVLDVLHGDYVNHQFLVAEPSTFAQTQIWYIEWMEGGTQGIVMIADATMTWCITRFSETERIDLAPPTNALQLEDTLLQMETAPRYHTDLLISHCDYIPQQFFYVTGPGE